MNIAFGYDHANASVHGWCYPEFTHDGNRSIVLLESGMSTGVLSYVLRDGPPYVLQIQGVRDRMPPHRWAQRLLAHLLASSDEVIVRAAHNNPEAHAFHDWLVSSGIYHEAGLGRLSFGQALSLDQDTRARLDVVVDRYLSVPYPDTRSLIGQRVVDEPDVPLSRLHPATAFTRYDVTARTVARSLKKRFEELDEEAARTFSVLGGDLFISG